nr:MAG: hypothetical protein [Lokiarchaeota virus Skoll Meg22_1214]
MKKTRNLNFLMILGSSFKHPPELEVEYKKHHKTHEQGEGLN